MLLIQTCLFVQKKKSAAFGELLSVSKTRDSSVLEKIQRIMAFAALGTNWCELESTEVGALCSDRATAPTIGSKESTRERPRPIVILPPDINSNFSKTHCIENLLLPRKYSQLSSRKVRGVFEAILPRTFLSEY